MKIRFRPTAVAPQFFANDWQSCSTYLLDAFGLWLTYDVFFGLRLNETLGKNDQIQSTLHDFFKGK